MRFATSVALAALLFTGFAHADVYEEVLRNAALEHGISGELPATPSVSPGLFEVGERLFEDKRLSLNGDTACKTCHLDRFGSADGLPNAIGVGGVGEGPERVESDGLIVPRNTLPLWGRGSAGYDVLFWDGKVEKQVGQIASQFGELVPSSDPLVVAVHLPFVEIREMIVDTESVTAKYETESVASAREIYEILTDRVSTDPWYAEHLSRAFSIPSDQIKFIHVAESIAAFIRTKFALRPTRFHRFVEGNERLSTEEIRGGLLFFGKGRCVSCHSGQFFSDLDFHVLPGVQAGFGKNGFGVDYGRFNVTHDPDDLYAFRTPPLIQVNETAPYGHSGAYVSLDDVVVAHFDPLRSIDTGSMAAHERVEFYRRITASKHTLDTAAWLDDEEVQQITSFLRALTFVEE